MQKDVLVELVADACGGKKPKNSVFELSEEDKASLLLDTEGSHMAIDGLTRLEVKEGYVVAHAARDAVYLVALERVLGLRLLRARRDSPGFHA